MHLITISRVPNNSSCLSLGGGGVAAMRHRLSPTSSLGVAFFEMKPKPILDLPTDVDICCGRGKGIWSHPGNLQFKKVIEQNIQRYSAAVSRNDKSTVIISVVEMMGARGARFVKRDEETGLWFDVGEYQAREKTAHAIRDYLAKIARRSSQRSLIAKKSKKNNNSKDNDTATSHPAAAAANNAQTQDDKDTTDKLSVAKSTLKEEYNNSEGKKNKAVEQSPSSSAVLPSHGTQPTKDSVDSIHDSGSRDHSRAAEQNNPFSGCNSLREAASSRVCKSALLPNYALAGVHLGWGFVGHEGRSPASRKEDGVGAQVTSGEQSTSEKEYKTCHAPHQVLKHELDLEELQQPTPLRPDCCSRRQAQVLEPDISPQTRSNSEPTARLTRSIPPLATCHSWECLMKATRKIQERPPLLGENWHIGGLHASPELKRPAETASCFWTSSKACDEKKDDANANKGQRVLQSLSCGDEVLRMLAANQGSKAAQTFNRATEAETPDLSQVRFQLSTELNSFFQKMDEDGDNVRLPMNFSGDVDPNLGSPPDYC